jgi:large subunit ribosomal protein L15
MDLSTLSNGSVARKTRKRVGRGPGSGNGKTSGKGHKGQKSRSGYARRIGFEGGQMPLHRRLPKRGFHHSKRQEMTQVNLDVLEKSYEAGEVVTVESLREKGIGRFLSSGVKILGRGEVTKKLTLQVHAISASARQKIEATGGVVELLEWRVPVTSASEAPAEV